MHPTVVLIRKVLRKKGISYTQLSRMSGIEESKIKRLLSGKQKMTLDIRDQIFATLSISDYCQAVDVTSTEYISLWNRMSPKAKQSILSLMIVMDEERK
ncbi:helix-turn-helix transcriptional regulator [Vibrio rhizosphaerae]|uniref:Helix-turn-helix transcriptional regulator n=1 Tax=Vibrio rhizosphaerae TaxID=398736 RepID=A0ABU4IXE4_9VIBR|nr:helix-turn-helix transcriptional regulator [Vibrio rhizosphaerae]MDW6094072.1 helix-turn-helix transcriptional regulator [Vibrio rhizosphaerae]